MPDRAHSHPREPGDLRLVPSALRAPRLETERLVLRPHTVDDFAPCAAMWADPTVTRFIGGKPSTEQQTWNRILTYAGHWALLGFGYWAVEEKQSRAFIGELGFANFWRDAAPSLRGVPEIGWAFAAAVHGRGFATEATRAVTGWGDEHFGDRRTVCMIAPENAASIRIAEKCGYRAYERGALGESAVWYFERI